MTKKIIILSDLFGEVKGSEVTHNYMEITAQFFKAMDYDVDFYSSPELGGIKNNDNTDSIHKLFLEFGIRNAATTLSRSMHQYDIGIGFSIGGLILWEACKINNRLVKHLVCISSTRLRYETTRIAPANITLIYGEHDSYSPSLPIIEKLSDRYLIIPSNDHDLYKDRAVLEEILRSIQCLEIKAAIPTLVTHGSISPVNGHSFFERADQEFIIENRHKNPELQRIYDQLYGIILK